MDDASVIAARSLRKRFGTVEALDGIDLGIHRGEVFGLIGPNGAGKTTLIRAFVGALEPSGGEVEVLGLHPLRDRWELRRRIGYMPQQAALYSDLSARRNVEFFAAAHRRHDDGRDVDRALDLVGLTSRADDPVRILSGGMQQRVSLACALVHEPEMLILDEPTAGVDPELRAAFWGSFHRTAREGTTVVVSTHTMGDALECDRVALIRAGKVLAVDDPRDLLRSNKATVHLWRAGEERTVSLDDYPDQLPRLLQGGADRVEVVLESLDDVVLSLIRGERAP